MLQAKTNSNTVTTPRADGTISVQGTGQVQITPDRGIVTIGVTTQATTAQAAAQSNANTMNSVISGLNGIGIGNDNIQTIYYNIYPQYSCCNSPSTITGYQATNEIQVTIIASGQTLAQLGGKVGLAIDTAANNGANQIYGVQFSAADSAIHQAQQTALQQGTEDASQRAHIIASALGATITGVVSVTTNPVYPEPIFYSSIELTASTTPINPPQTVTFTETVQAVFSIS